MFGKKGAPHVYQRNSVTSEHITALICIRADGLVLPPLIVFKNATPKTAYKTIGPVDAMYRTTDSGYVNADLYLEYIQFLEKLIPGMFVCMKVM